MINYPVRLSLGHENLTDPAGVFGGLGPADGELIRDNVAARSITRRFSVGTTLWKEGEHLSQVLLIVSGMVKFSHPTPLGDALIDIRRGGSFVGEIEALAGQPSGFEVSAISDVVVHQMRRDDFLRAVHSRPSITAVVMRTLARRLLLMQRYQQGYKGDVAQRLAQRLLDLGLVLHPYGLVDTFTVPATQREIAASIGVSTASVENELRKLRQAGVICAQRRRNSIQVLRPRTLRKLLTDEIDLPGSYDRFVNSPRSSWHMRAS